MSENINSMSAQAAWNAVKDVAYGRIQRIMYWAIMGPCLVIGTLVGRYVMRHLLDYDNNLGVILGLVAHILCLAVMVWACVRRLHDLDKSAWWVLPFCPLAFIPYLGAGVILVAIIVIGCLPGTPGTNRFGRAPGTPLPWDAGGSPVTAGFCPQCGEPLEPGQKFCPKCGTAVVENVNAPD